MNPIYRVARILVGVTGTATLVLGYASPAPLALARPDPPGYYWHPCLPITHPRVHTVLAGGTPEWKIILIATAAALLGATTTRLLPGPAQPGRSDTRSLAACWLLRPALLASRSWHQPPRLSRDARPTPVQVFSPAAAVPASALKNVRASTPGAPAASTPPR